MLELVKKLGACPVWEGELWTAKQRQMHRLHYIVSYRASFKPELPDFFIRHYLLERGISKGKVLDTFGGRGTTALQANLLGYTAIHNDLNPISIFLAQTRQNVPSRVKLKEALASLDLSKKAPKLNKRDQKRLSPFFHPKTLKEILNLREKILETNLKKEPTLAYIALVALSRLHGHSDGFFSIYTFPQISISPEAQEKNNLRLTQEAEYKEVKSRILRKMNLDLYSPLPKIFANISKKNIYTQNSSTDLKSIKNNTVDLIVTSPPFLDKVNYQLDNWMRAWFLGMEEESQLAPLSITSNLGEWTKFMVQTMKEMERVLKPGAHAVIEVGEVKCKGIHRNLEEVLIENVPEGKLRAKEIFINQQSFTKLSNCWSVQNNSKGTNSNRCLVLEKQR